VAHYKCSKHGCWLVPTTLRYVDRYRKHVTMHVFICPVHPCPVIKPNKWRKAEVLDGGASR
jgi:hypothetical protein